MSNDVWEWLQNEGEASPPSAEDEGFVLAAPAQWRTIDRKVFTFLLLNLSDAILQEVRTKEHAHGLWKRITDLYKDKSIGRIMRLEKEIYQLQYGQFNSLAGLTRKMRELWDDLVAAGGEMTSTRMAQQLLFKLSERFDSFYQSLIQSGRTSQPTWEEILPQLMQIESRAEFRAGGAVGADGALMAKSSGNKGKQKQSKDTEDSSKKGKKKKSDKKSDKNRESKIICYICDKKGHGKRDCPKWKKD